VAGEVAHVLCLPRAQLDSFLGAVGAGLASKNLIVQALRQHKAFAVRRAQACVLLRQSCGSALRMSCTCCAGVRWHHAPFPPLSCAGARVLQGLRSQELAAIAHAGQPVRYQPGELAAVATPGVAPATFFLVATGEVLLLPATLQIPPGTPQLDVAKVGLARVRLSVCLSFCLSVCLSVCLCVGVGGGPGLLRAGRVSALDAMAHARART
jgi:hypothetical protein